MTELDRRSYLRGTVAATGGAAIVGPGASGAAAAQEPGTTVWDLAVGADNDTTFHAVAPIDDGSRYIFVGDRKHSDSGHSYEWWAIVSGEGEVVHSRSEPRSQPNPGTFRDVVPVGDGTFYAAGQAAGDEGSYPYVVRIEPKAEEGIEYHWRQTPGSGGIKHAVASTPDDGVVAAGVERDADGGHPVGQIVKLSAGGGVDWVYREDPEDLEVVFADVVTDGIDGAGVCGFARAEDGSRKGVAGVVSPDGESSTVGTIGLPADHEGSVFRALQSIDGDPASLEVVGEAVDSDGRSTAYVAPITVDGEKTREHFPPSEGDESGFHDAVRHEATSETIYVGYEEGDEDRQGFVLVVNEGATDVARQVRGNSGDDTFLGAVVGDRLVLAGRVQTGPSEFGGWAHAMVSGSGGDGTNAGGDDGPSGAGGDGTAGDGGGPDGEEQRQRGFVSHDGDDPDFLSNAANLTTIGFLLSVFGIAHQMLKGR